MLDFFRDLFATDFMPHVFCLRLPGVIWLHVISDSLIASSYFLIPAALVLLIRRRRDLAFSWMFALFGLFILACGATHVLNVYTLWHPIYRFDGLVKAITALASVPTAILLFRLLPQAVSLPSPSQLQQEVEVRRGAEEHVRVLNAQLEHRVMERTAALAASEARFRAAVEAVGDIIWTNDADGRMIGEQRHWAAFTGQTREEYENYGWTQALHPADAQPTLQAWKEAVANGRMFQFEHRVRRRDGRYRLFSIRAVPVFDESGRMREWVGVHSDITDAREIEEDLRRAKLAAEAASRAKSAFLASMSHELRTPLNAIIGYSEMLEEQARESSSEQMVEDLQRVHTSGRHLLGLIDDVLDLSKIEAGRMELHVETVPLEKIVEDVASSSRPLFEKQRNRFTVRMDRNAKEMRTDIGKLRQCLLNLLSNAAKFTQEGNVTLDVQATSNDAVLFRVSDTGIGITTQQMDRLFEPFMQAESSTARRFGGTGLGLALTRHLVRMLNGEVTAASIPGEGAVFTIQIPRELAST